jgi:hypothetical protein
VQVSGKDEFLHGLGCCQQAAFRHHEGGSLSCQ